MSILNYSGNRHHKKGAFFCYQPFLLQVSLGKRSQLFTTKLKLSYGGKTTKEAVSFLFEPSASRYRQIPVCSATRAYSSIAASGIAIQ